MSILLWFAVWAVALPAVFAFAPRDVPTPTVGCGLPIYELVPTEAPSMELVKKQLQKKAVTNVCTEWALEGGGHPECFNSQTCLFTSAYGYNYEGCGETSIRYNWITACYNYPQVGTPPVSEIFCPQSAPACGFYAFVFGPGATYYNFGCSITSYGSIAYLLSTTDNGGAPPSSVVLQGGTTVITTLPPTTVVVTTQPVPTASSGALNLNSGSTTFSQTSASINTAPNQSSPSSTLAPTPLPVIGNHSPPTGAIVGGVLGSIALLALLAFLAWFFIRKHKQDSAASAAHEIQVQQNPANAANAATATAFHNNQYVSEISGKPYAPVAAGVAGAGAYGAISNEKPFMASNTQEYYQPSQPPQPPYNPNIYPPIPATYHGVSEPHSGSQSPPPIYGHPSPPPPPSQSNPSYPASPHSRFSELDNAGRTVSMMTPPPSMNPAATGGANELPGGPQRGNVPEMSASTGGIARKPLGGGAVGGGRGAGGAGGQRMPQMDMSGNPMSEDYHHHELE